MREIIKSFTYVHTVKILFPMTRNSMLVFQTVEALNDR